jgi:hypothetical protein
MDEGRGLRPGLIVRDAAGNTLGKVRRVYPWGFEAGKGFWSPYQWVFRNDEVLRLDGEAVEVTRSPDDLQRLAAGELPASWSRGTSAAEDRPSTPQERKGPPKLT